MIKNELLSFAFRPSILSSFAKVARKLPILTVKRGVPSGKAVSVQKNVKKALTATCLFGIVPIHTVTTITKMRTKTLILSAAAAVAGIFPASAQVYSVNVVGYVTDVMTNQFSMIANPLNGASNTINGVLGTAPSTSQFYFWTGAGFNSTIKIGAAWQSNVVFAPGGGGVLKLAGAGPYNFTNTYVGEVMQGNLSTPIGVTAYSLVSSKVPQGGTPEVLGLTTNIVGQAQLFKWRGTPPGYNSFVKLAAGTSFLGAPSIRVAEAFILFSTNSASWNRTFTVQ